jgi:hypothetical protein
MTILNTTQGRIIENEVVVNAYSDKLGVNGCPFNYREKMRLIIVSVLFGQTAQLVMKEIGN